MMLRHLACISVDEQVNAEANVDAVISVAKDKDKVSSEPSIISNGTANDVTLGLVSQARDSNVHNCATAAAGLFTTSSLNDVVSLPPMVNLCFTCRLFGNNSGKLLTHFEDVLEMYADPAPLSTQTSRGGGSTAVRLPIMFRIPTPTEREVNDEEQEKMKNLTMSGDSPNLQYSRLLQHRNNSYFDTRRVKSSPSSATVSSNATGTAATLNSGAYYYGSVRDLSLGYSTTTTTTTKRLRCCTKARIGQTSRHVLLEELDKESGRTAVIGCVPTVPVARCRVATHKAAAAAAARM